MPFPTKTKYRGRFAPSPTGPLHFGSLVAAVASYIDAKSHSGTWLVRIDDIDHQRCKPEYNELILHTLESYGLEWDEEVVYQQQQLSQYEEILQRLIESDDVYRCVCTRKILPNGPYPGNCRNKKITDADSSIRLKVKNNDGIVNDLIQAKFQQNLISDVGDFVIYRSDKMFSYHLATVIDDHKSGITHIIRGADLLDSTPRQIYLQILLEYKTPIYGHIPVVINQQGEKLSKQTFAKPIDEHDIQTQLTNALKFLGQSIPQDLIYEEPKIILDWATKHWDINLIPKIIQ